VVVRSDGVVRGLSMGPDGRSTVVATRLDQRCSYCLYSPVDVRENATFRNLIVYVHGQGRRFQYLLNALMPLARSCQSLLVCPLFPANILRDGNLEGYKYLYEGHIRYDQILIDLVSELRDTFAFAEARFLLGGFSGGGQFAHRFCYLHPEMLKAVSVAAPGSVTLLDQDLPWWPGIGSVAELFGHEVDLHTLKSVKVQLIVGANDTRDDEVSFRTRSKSYMASRNRVERLHSLHTCLLGHGINAKLEIVPHSGHNFSYLLPQIAEFFKQCFDGSEVPAF